MLPRRAPLVCLALLACATLAQAQPGPGEAERLWEKGQQALLEGKSEQAIAYYRQSLALAPKLARNHLSLAAAYLERGDERKAALHLDTYLRLQPDHVAVRGQYADQLLRLGQPRLAKEQLERFVADLQGNDAL